MKLKHLMMASALCLSLAASPSAFACEHGNGWLFTFFHHCDHDRDDDRGNHNSGRQCDQNGQNSGQGNNCDRGRGNGGGYCGSGGSSSGGGSSTGGGTSTGGSSSGGGGIIYK
jgi:hypothetical protein